jgi:hypothetical protein
LVGLLATICVLFRMVDRPAPLEQVFSLSLAWGIWLALVGSAAIVIGSLWSTLRGSQNPSASSLATAWDGLSGWTPDA